MLIIKQLKQLILNKEVIKIITREIEEVLLRNKENLITMFIIKNEDGKYLFTQNPYFNYLSFPCKFLKLSELEVVEKRDEASSILMSFLKKEFNFVGLLNKYIEGLRCVANIDGELKLCNLVCFVIKTDDDLTEAVNKKIPFEPSEQYKNKKFFSVEEIKQKFWKREIDMNSTYYVLRSLEETIVPTITVTENIDLNIEGN